MLTKQQKYIQRQYLKGTVDVVQLAKRMGYRKAALTKGITKVRSLLDELGIAS
jgi:hypothetical protein